MLPVTSDGSGSGAWELHPAKRLMRPPSALWPSRPLQGVYHKLAGMGRIELPRQGFGGPPVAVTVIPSEWPPSDSNRDWYASEAHASARLG